MSVAVAAEREMPFAGETVEVRPYEAIDADLPPIFWPESAVPTAVMAEWLVEMARPPREPAASAIPSVSNGKNTANCARSAKRGHWWTRKRLDWTDGYCILLRIEIRFGERPERIPEVQAILNLCRHLVLVEIGYRGF